MKDLSTNQIPTWCPGCENYKLLASLKGALTDLKLEKKNVVICYDIGCGGNMVNLLDVCGVATLHGRPVAFACGVKAANEKLTVIAQAGDGGLLNEGLNHFIHAVKRDDPITIMVNNNLVFGLTAGQQSFGTPKGALARASLKPNQSDPLSVVDLAAVSGGRFIARTLSGDLNMTRKILAEAIAFKGVSVVEIIEPCKIWAKNFPEKKYKELKKPFKDRKSLIGKDDLVGLLYFDNSK